MGAGVNVNPVADMDVIRAIIMCDEIAIKFNPDDAPVSPGDIQATNKKEFATFEVGGVPVGVLVMDNITEGVLGIHPYLLECAKPLYRDMWQSMTKFLTWYRPDVEHLSASVQTCHGRLIRLCGYFGFVPFYKEFDSSVKYGRTVDRIHMINSNWRYL